MIVYRNYAQLIFNASRRFFHNSPINFNTSLITTSFNNGIKRITLNDPKTRNSLSIKMMQTLLDHIIEDEQDKNLRVIVLNAQGNIFSSGHNLKELAPANKTSGHKLVFDVARQLMITLINSPVPIIAQVDGLAAAAGCQLVAQCDIALCSDKSTFCTPGANFGIFCSTPGVALARCVPKMNALYMLLTGRSITSTEAKLYGLVSEVFPGDKLEEEVEKICQDIIIKSRSVIELGKKTYYQQVNQDIRNAYQLAGGKMVENLCLKDGKEGISSFIEKRKPNWSHSD